MFLLSDNRYVRSVGQDCTEISCDSTLDVTFRIPGTTPLKLVGTMSAEKTLSFGFAASTVRLGREATLLSEAAADPDTPRVDFDFDQVLGPGVYRLMLEADEDVGIDPGFDCLMVTNPVGPAVTGLGAAALIGFAISAGVVGRRALRDGLQNPPERSSLRRSSSMYTSHASSFESCRPQTSSVIRTLCHNPVPHTLRLGLPVQSPSPGTRGKATLAVTSSARCRSLARWPLTVTPRFCGGCVWSKDP